MEKAPSTTEGLWRATGQYAAAHVLPGRSRKPTDRPVPIRQLEQAFCHLAVRRLPLPQVCVSDYRYDPITYLCPQSQCLCPWVDG